MGYAHGFLGHAAHGTSATRNELERGAANQGIVATVHAPRSLVSRGMSHHKRMQNEERQLSGLIHRPLSPPCLRRLSSLKTSGPKSGPMLDSWEPIEAPKWRTSKSTCLPHSSGSTPVTRGGAGLKSEGAAAGTRARCKVQGEDRGGHGQNHGESVEG